MGSKQDNTNLFRVLQRGDRQIKSSHEKAILLAGLTRAGKSTTFNWILHKPMIGVMVDEVDAFYKTVIDDASTAELGDTFTSVTLSPNVVELDPVEKITLMDMAGYQDKRDYIGVLGVSYFLKAVFERIKEVKFLIVIDEQKLLDNAGDGILNTFTGFLNMFNLTDIPADIRSAFYSSISLVVTRSERAARHQGCLRRISTMVNDQRLHVINKAEVVMLINSIIDRNRIQAFPVALPDQNPPQCNFFERFNNLGWNYFNVANSEQLLKREIITLPFSRDFIGLSNEQRDKFFSCIKARVDSYVQFSKIINILIHNIKQGWITAVDDWKNTGQLNLDLSRCEALFEKVRQFLDKNDFYNSEKLVTPQIKPEYKKLNLVETIKQVLKIYDITDQIGNQADNNFMGNMIIYSGLFKELVGCLSAFAASKEDDHLLLRLNFLLERGFREFSKLYQLDANTIHEVNQKMKDNCNDIFEEQRKEFIEIFISRIDPELLQVLFPRSDQLEEYEGFFTDYERDYSHLQEPIYFKEHRYGFETAKAKNYIKDGIKNKAIHCFLHAYKNLNEIAFSSSHSYKAQEEIEQELNEIHMKKLALVGNMCELLKGIKDARHYALILAKYVKDIHLTCEIYELSIQDAEPSSKGELLDDFAEFCLDWGRLEQANTLLQRKLSLEKGKFDSYMATIKKLTIIAMDKSKYAEKYIENLNSWTRLAEDDPMINGYLDELEMTVPNQ